MPEKLIPEPFLAAILEKPCFRLADPETISQVNFQAGSDGFAYAKVDTKKPWVAEAVQDAGFRLIDSNVQLDRPMKGEWPGTDLKSEYEIRPAKSEDHADVERVAGNSFIFTRFHLDPKVPDKHANAIKARWAGNYFTGKRGDQMLVAAHKGRAVGFLQLLAREETLVIDLIAVEKAHQGNGLATGMITHAAESNADRERMLVGTQIANTPSLRAYEKLGFRVCASDYLFHYHGPIEVEANG